MTTLLPQVREHINAADFQTVATFLPPAGEGRTLAVSANEKAVILRGGRVVDMFSGGSKPIQMNDEAVIASLRKYQLVIGFGDCSDSHYNFSPTQIHASSPSFRIADGEEIRSMIVAVSFALDKDDRSNVEKLMAVSMANAGAITVADLAAGLPDLPQFIQTLIAIQNFDGTSIKTADPKRVAGIERQILLAADGMLREYGVISDGAALNVIATSRDAELSLPEKEREANAEHLLKLVNLHREDGRLERQIQSMKKRLETERIARQAEMMRTEIMEERLKQSRIQSEIERLDPRIGAAPTNGEPISPPKTTAAPTAQSGGNPSRGGDDANVPSDANLPDYIRKALANMHVKDADCKTPLHHAAENGDIKMAKALIDAGADVNAKDRLVGKTPLRHAAENGDMKMAKALIDAGADVNAKDRFFTLLHIAAGNGHTETAQTLIDAGADVNAKGSRLVDITPLHIATRNGHMETAQTLIDAGADVNAKDGSFGNTPLHTAAGNGHTETAQTLIDAGADVNAKDGSFGNTPLHTAAGNGHTETAQTLIDAGADVNAKDRLVGKTPLRHAAENGDMKMAKALIDAGADVNAKDRFTGNTPLHIAARNGHTEMAQLIRNAGGREG